MNAVEIKQKLINNKELDLSNAIFICPNINQKYIAYSYIKEYARIKNLDISRVYKEGSLSIDYKKFISIKDIDQNKNNVIYFSDCAYKDLEDYEKLVYIPELTEKDFSMLIKSKIPSFSLDRVNNFIELCNNNIFIILNELDKILISKDVSENVALLSTQDNYKGLQKPSSNAILINLITKNSNNYVKELNKELSFVTTQDVKDIYETILKELNLIKLLLGQEKITKVFLKENFIDEAEYRFLKTNCLDLFTIEEIERKIDYLNKLLKEDVTIVNLKENLITLYIK